MPESGKSNWPGLCTACHLEDWYSHRAERGHTGRFGAIIALDSDIIALRNNHERIPGSLHP